MLRSGTALLWAMVAGIVIHDRRKRGVLAQASWDKAAARGLAKADKRTNLSGHRVAYHRMTGCQAMLLLTLLIKCDAMFSGDDGLNHLADGLRHSSLAGMCLSVISEVRTNGFSFDSGRYITGDNGAFFFERVNTCIGETVFPQHLRRVLTQQRRGHG